MLGYCGHGDRFHFAVNIGHFKICSSKTFYHSWDFFTQSSIWNPLMVANWMLQPHHAGLLWAWWSFFIACVWFLAIYQPWCQLLVLKRAELAASNPSQINTQLYRGHLSLQLDNWTLLEFPEKSLEKILKMYFGCFQNNSNFIATLNNGSLCIFRPYF